MVLKVDKGDDENPMDFKSEIFSICVCRVDLYVNVVGLHIMKEHPNYWEFRKTVVVY